MSQETHIGTLLADQLDKLFTRQVDPAKLVAIEAGLPIIDIWSAVEQQGAALALAGGDIGAGLSWQETLPMLRTLGWHGAPVPLAETLIGASALTSVGLDLPEGPIAISAAEFELDDHNRITGEDQLVAWLPQCNALVGQAHRNAERCLFVVATGDLRPRQADSLARIPSASLTLQHQPVTACAALQGQDIVADLAIVRAAMISGILDRVLALTVDYANTRQQFGRTIGKFQAIQHHVANIAMQTAQAQAAVIFACQQRDCANASHAAAVAKICTGSAATISASAAHQVLGAIGITQEHELHLLTRRLWQWRAEAGSDHYWAERLGRNVINAGGPALWPLIAG